MYTCMCVHLRVCARLCVRVYVCVLRLVVTTVKPLAASPLLPHTICVCLCVLVCVCVHARTRVGMCVILM